jgi:hypothetical protein
MHQQSKALSFMPSFLLTLIACDILMVFVSVTIGIGEVIQRENASARDVDCGLISCFIGLDTLLLNV